MYFIHKIVLLHKSGCIGSVTVLNCHTVTLHQSGFHFLTAFALDAVMADCPIRAQGAGRKAKRRGFGVAIVESSLSPPGGRVSILALTFILVTHKFPDQKQEVSSQI